MSYVTLHYISALRFYCSVVIIAIFFTDFDDRLQPRIKRAEGRHIDFGFTNEVFEFFGCLTPDDKCITTKAQLGKIFVYLEGKQFPIVFSRSNKTHCETSTLLYLCIIVSASQYNIFGFLANYVEDLETRDFKLKRVLPLSA